MDRAVPYLLVGLLALGLLVVLGFVAVRGFEELDGGAEPYPYEYDDPWAQPAAGDSAFVYAEPYRLRAQAPPPLTMALPDTRVEVRTFADYRPSPTARVRALLSIGDLTMRRNLFVFMDWAREDGATEAELAPVYGPFVLGHPTPTHCAWLREQLAREDLPLRDAFHDALLTCEDGATARFLEEHDGDEHASADPDALLRDPSTSVDALAATWKGSPDALTRALVRCAAADPTDEDAPGAWRSAECLTALHALSPPLALQAGRAVHRRGPELPYLRETAAVLAERTAGEAVVGLLYEHGLLRPGDAPVEQAPHAVAPRDVLRNHGRALCFEEVPGTRPVGHDGLAVRLAHLVRPALDDVLFSENEPWSDAYDCELVAYAAGEQHSVTARNLGGRFDVHAVLGLLNRLLRDRYSDLRLAWLSVPTADLTCVAAGPERGLLSAENANLITLQDPPAR